MNISVHKLQLYQNKLVYFENIQWEHAYNYTIMILHQLLMYTSMQHSLL